MAQGGSNESAYRLGYSSCGPEKRRSRGHVGCRVQSVECRVQSVGVVYEVSSLGVRGSGFRMPFNVERLQGASIGCEHIESKKGEVARLRCMRRMGVVQVVF